MQVMHAFSHIIYICIRVAAAAEEVIYEVVAEPPEAGAIRAGPAGGEA